MGGELRVGQVYRYASGKDPKPAMLDGFPNFHHVTHSTGHKRALLDAFTGHQGHTPEERAAATPLLLFRAVSQNGKPKGHVEFCGVGILERTERLVQWGGREHTTFVNYVYDIALIDLTSEGDAVAWDCIQARRDNAVSDGQALKLAPQAWREWVKHGSSALPRLRRRVARAQVTKVRDQRPEPRSGDAADLELVYRYFDGRKHDFEALAAVVTARVLRGSGRGYVEGWLTRRSGDGGADFVGRLDLGSGLAGTSLVVLGQAKCVKPDTLITAEQIARVVARLRRGWIGVYVTTGAYSEPAQTEMVEDQYPIILINGMSLVSELGSMARDDHGGDLTACIEHVLSSRASTVTNRRPEEILLQ
ncbi:restriction endonuclease [Streptomyces sp. GB4-14]|uniref:restriction endonuclease n=1 Tax=Streptomyces sp. GB4-14 TaxID=2498703 RepID=UPI001F5FBB5C|nr:restriction endonuclease [Streptomyces sp. GB4-14]